MGPNLICPGDNLRVRLNAPIGSGSTIPLSVGTFPVMFSAAKFVDVAVLEYEWDGKKHQMTNSEFVTAFQDLPGYRQENYNNEEGKVEYLQELLSEKLKLLAAESAGFHEDEDLLHKAEDYRNQLLVEKLTEVEVDEKVAYTEPELVDYYEAHKEEYVEEETVRATCVSLLDENKAEEAYAMLQEGDDIAEIAEKFKNDLRGPGDGPSDPGNTGFFTRDASENWMPFVNALFDMEIGVVTEEQMELDIGDDVYYLIFRKEEQKPSRQETFDEVKDSIVTIIEQQKKRERILSWVDEVTKKGKLKLYPELIPVPDKPTEEDAVEGTVIAEFEWKGKHQITLEEMMQEISELPEYKQKQYSETKEGLEEYMTLMAESRLILMMAKEQDLDQDGKIQKKVQEDLHELMVEKITGIEVEQKVKPTEADFKAYYEANISEYVSPEQVRVTCIAVSNKETTEKALTEIHQDGRDITEIAKELSEKGELEGPGSDPNSPGDTGFFSRDSFSGVVKPFVDLAFDLQIGEINKEIIEVEVQSNEY